MDYCTKNGQPNELIFIKAKFGPKANRANGTVEDPNYFPFLFGFWITTNLLFITFFLRIMHRIVLIVLLVVSFYVPVP